MECCITWVFLTMSIQLVMSYNVTLSPDSITTEVGTDSVIFPCRIELEIFETYTEHWIIWWKDTTKIADNDIVINSTKYSVHGVSSTAMVKYTQILQVHDIKESDHGIYTCTLVFPSYPPAMKQITTSSFSTLIIRKFISQPVCYINPSVSETGQQQMTLFCTSAPSDPPIILYWMDNNGNISAITQQQNQNEAVTLSYIVSIESLSSNLMFKCKATSTDSTEDTIKECVINLTSMTMTPTTTVSQKQSISETFDEKATTSSITVSPPLSVLETTSDRRSTAIPTKTINMAISNSPITLNIIGTSPQATKPTSKEQNDITTSINVKPETSLLYISTSNVTEDKPFSSSNNKSNTTTIIIFGILAGVIILIVFIAMLLLRTHFKRSKNEEIHLKKSARQNSLHSNSENEYPGETDIHNENQEHRLITIEFGDGQLDCEVYKNSIYETNTDDLDPFYAAVGQKNVEESQRIATTDDPKKTKDIYPMEDNPEYMSIEETALKKATAPPIKAEKPKKLTVNNYPAPNGEMYAQVDRSSISSSGRLSNIMNEEVKNYRAPNGDMYAQVDKSSNSISERLSTHTNEENKVKNYPAPNGDMYAQVDRSSNSISDRLSTLLINEEQESIRRKKSEGKNNQLTDETKENIGVSKKSSRFIDNDDTYTTISEIAQNSDGEEETNEFTEAEDKDDKREDDSVSRTSVGSSGSIHYEVDSNAVYTRVSKSQKSTTD